MALRRAWSSPADRIHAGELSVVGLRGRARRAPDRISAGGGAWRSLQRCFQFAPLSSGRTLHRTLRLSTRAGICRAMGRIQAKWMDRCPCIWHRERAGLSIHPPFAGTRYRGHLCSRGCSSRDTHSLTDRKEQCCAVMGCGRKRNAAPGGAAFQVRSSLLRRGSASTGPSSFSSCSRIHRPGPFWAPSSACRWQKVPGLAAPRLA